ncbi:hypothetical protein Tco_0974280 [Tanacetum coccineum]|uniref:Uncharacterized protein n=1 Tax=Tanacetum coccineum TaxID=301880 RepID=A0ABQ5EB50_9ASTR
MRHQPNGVITTIWRSGKSPDDDETIDLFISPLHTLDILRLLESTASRLFLELRPYITLAHGVAPDYVGLEPGWLMEGSTIIVTQKFNPSALSHVELLFDPELYDDSYDPDNTAITLVADASQYSITKLSVPLGKLDRSGASNLLLQGPAALFIFFTPDPKVKSSEANKPFFSNILHCPDNSFNSDGAKRYGAQANVAMQVCLFPLRWFFLRSVVVFSQPSLLNRSPKLGVFFVLLPNNLGPGLEQVYVVVQSAIFGLCCSVEVQVSFQTVGLVTSAPLLVEPFRHAIPLRSNMSRMK